MSLFFAQLRHDVGNLDRGARGFGAAIDIVLEATFARLRFGFHAEDGVDDGNAGFERDALERVGHCAGEMFGMIGFAFEDDAHGDDGVRFLLQRDLADDDGDFKCARNLVQSDDGGGTISAQLARSVFDEALDVIRVEAAGDNDEIAPAENHAGLSRSDLGDDGRVRIAR